MFTPIHLPHLRNSEFLNFFKDIDLRCKRFDVVALGLTSRARALTSEYAKLELAYNKKGGSDITDLLDALDDRRDDAITGIKICSEGFVRSFSKPISNAARLIFESFSRHPVGIARLNRKAETSEINSLIREWKDTTELTAALETLGFTSWVAELREANSSYAATEQDRVDDVLQSEGDSFTELRLGAKDVYATLCKGIEAHYELNENPEHLKMANTINLIVDEYNLILTKRKGGDEDDTGTEDEAP